MNNFEYASPATIQEAVALLGSKWGEADVLAGGTDLISLMKEEVHTPKRVVNIKGIQALGGIAKSAAGLRIGATVTMQELMENALVRAEFPALVQAARGIHSPQIRNMGTVGGDLCQRPRCWYFRHGHGLLAEHVVEGRNEFHAIFTDGPARFVSASSLGPALVALGAKVKLVSAKGTRELAVEKFFVSPKSVDEREIALLPGEILTEIVVPEAKTRNAIYEVRQKEALDWPLAAAAVALRMNGSVAADVKIVLGHVAPAPWPASAAAKLIEGKTVTPELAEAAGKAAAEGAKPLSENAYKVRLVQTAVKRALLEAARGKA
jgi:xanthine dehydrogenase YagS FAD-binding subunit